MKIKNQYYQGNGVIPGIVIGRAFVIEREKDTDTHSHIVSQQVEIEIDRFKNALKKGFDELEMIKNKISADHKDPGHILEAHQMMIQDEELQKQVIETIRHELVNAEWAINKTLEKWKTLFLSVDDEYMQERISDLKFVSRRLIRNLSGKNNYIAQPPPDAIVVAKELSPAETIQIGKNAISGMVIEKGGKTSHTIIIAKAFEIPTIVGIKNITTEVGTGDLLLLDANSGQLIANPDVEMVQKYRTRMHKALAFEQNLLKQSAKPAKTKDDYTIKISANIDFVNEIEAANSHGAEGIGLYRTEFLFINNFRDALDEKLHFKDTLKLLESSSISPITIRTFDLGGDKFPLEADFSNEPNPALGLRSIRLALKERTILKSQLRGILRAYIKNHSVELRIMFPLVGSMEEFLSAKEVYWECINELLQEGHDIPDNISIGTMIELPSACMISDHLATKSDFFSIGSNDLTQYSLGIDRNNDMISDLYQPLHPGILRLIKRTIKSAKNAKIPISVCGDTATDPIAALILIGMGIENLSMPPAYIPHIKKLIRNIELRKVEKITEQALEMQTAKGIIQLFIKNFEEAIDDSRLKYSE
ncbi:MAG: phosphoenolpyruvate--protein phosphotransferase [Deltaproteobacteria bacterium]|jgi:phosphotransferase system enzyme I (PtsI)|nr:phosphoenolpyruvate--protein phosphotransferase [Deltaproteobacteria bacterium]